MNKLIDNDFKKKKVCFNCVCLIHLDINAYILYMYKKVSYNMYEISVFYQPRLMERLWYQNLFILGLSPAGVILSPSSKER